MRTSGYFYQLVLGLALFFGATQGAQAVSAMSVISEPGDYIGLGATKTYTGNTSLFLVSGNSDYLQISVGNSVDHWSIVLSAPRGEPFMRRNYPDAERASFRTGRSPGLDIGANNRGCNQVWGSFAVRQVEFDANGNITMLDAVMIQRCGSATSPRLIVALSYKATPLSFELNSIPGDYVGLGMKKSYFGDTSDFAMLGTTNSLQFAVSGQRDDWVGIIQPPSGQRLHVGTYQTQSLRDGTHASMFFLGDGRGCGQTGELIITNITADAAGQITGLHAAFALVCDGSTKPLTGKIRFHL